MAAAGGLPLAGTWGWYSSKLSYAEWHRLASARLCHEEMANANPRNVFNVLTGCLVFPWLAIGAGFMHLFSNVICLHYLFDDNSIKRMKAGTTWKAVQRYSYYALNFLSVAAAFKLLDDNYDLASQLSDVRTKICEVIGI